MTKTKNFNEFLLSNADSSKLTNHTTKNRKKRAISMRVDPELIEDIDGIIPYTKFRNRTEFMEFASKEFCEFIEDLINTSEFEKKD